MNDISRQYFIGGGIASLAGAVFAIRDGNVRGEHIYIFDAAEALGGAMDGCGNAEDGYTALGARKYAKTSESYACLYDLMETIPGIENRGKTLYREFLEWNEKFPKVTNDRLIDKNRKSYKIMQAGLSKRHVLRLVELSFIPEAMIERRGIDSWFAEDFFQTDFWFGFSTMFGFKSYHDLIEMRRYIRKFADSFQHMKASGNDVNAVEVTHPINQYESLILPIQQWLAENGVNFLFASAVVDLDFAKTDAITVRRIHYSQRGEAAVIDIESKDNVYVTIGSKVADATYGTMTKAPAKPARDQLHPAWQLWRNIAEKKPRKFGNPENFYSQVERSEWTWYCVTTKDKLFFDLFEEKTGNAPGVSDAVSSVHTPWCTSVQVPAQPHFLNQPEDTHFWMGYGLYSNRIGEFVKKPMNDCSGAEILTEIVYQYGFEAHLDRILENSICIPIYEPYVTAQFLTRKVSDRPVVVPDGSTNLAFLGQFVETGECVFLVEQSVRTGMEATYQLLNLKRDPIPLYMAIDHPKNVINLVSALSG